MKGMVPSENYITLVATFSFFNVMSLTAPTQAWKGDLKLQLSMLQHHTAFSQIPVAVGHPTSAASSTIWILSICICVTVSESQKVQVPLTIERGLEDFVMGLTVQVREKEV